MKLLKRIEKNLLYKYIGTALICSSIVLTIISFSSAFILSSQQISFFDNENIDVESISVNMRDGILVKGLIYVDKDLKENTTNSIPTILLLICIKYNSPSDKIEEINSSTLFSIKSRIVAPIIDWTLMS